MPLSLQLIWRSPRARAVSSLIIPAQPELIHSIRQGALVIEPFDYAIGRRSASGNDRINALTILAVAIIKG